MQITGRSFRLLEKQTEGFFRWELIQFEEEKEDQ